MNNKSISTSTTMRNALILSAHAAVSVQGSLRGALSKMVYPAATSEIPAIECTAKSCPGLEEGNKNGMCTYQIKYSQSAAQGAAEDQHGYIMYPCSRRREYNIQEEHFDRGPVLLKELDSLWNTVPSAIAEPSSADITEIYFIAGGNGMRARETIPFFSKVLEHAQNRVDVDGIYQDKIRKSIFLFVDMPGYGGGWAPHPNFEPPNGGYPSPSTSLDANRYLLHTITDIVNKRQSTGHAQIEHYNFFGHSMGCANVLQVAAHDDFKQKTKRITLYAPFDSTFSMLDHFLEMVGEEYRPIAFAAPILRGTANTFALMIKRFTWDNIAEVKKLQNMDTDVEFVIMHSALDRVVPFEKGRNLVESIPADIKNVKFFGRHESADSAFSISPWHDPRETHRDEDMNDLFDNKYAPALFGTFEAAPGVLITDHQAAPSFCARAVSGIASAPGMAAAFCASTVQYARGSIGL